MHGVKQYIYISETKVEMLYGQLVGSIEKYGAEYGVDVKLFKWTGKRESEQVVNIYTKLNRVVDFIKQTKKIGTPGRPKTFIAGTSQFRWGPFVDRAVYFQCDVSTTKALVLVGSLKHVLGVSGAPRPGIFIPSSARPTALGIGQALALLLKGETTGLEQENLRDFLGDDSEAVANVIQQFRNRVAAPLERLEFLAQTYLREESLVIGTPLYVAAAE